VRTSHAEPVRGGRKRADGVDVRWAVTFPGGEKGGQDKRGRVPFFCHDITERSVRVPMDEVKTAHECGAVGVRELTVVVKDRGLLEETRKVYETILGGGKGTPDGGEELRFRIGHIHQVEGVDDGPQIVLRLPGNDEERKSVKRQGFWYGDVVFFGKAGPEKTAGTKERLDNGSGEEGVGGLWIEYI
jgi:hypothetical protein